jgi:hypothetical protein
MVGPMSTPALTTRSSNKLRAKVARGEGFVALALEGVIDEHSALGALTPQLGAAPTLLIDVGLIRRLNSVGVRDWVHWLRELRQHFPEVILFDAPPPFMTEVNFVRNFAEGAYIASFGVPLFCARCQTEDIRTLTVDAVRDAPPRLPAFPCTHPDCDNALDDDEDAYLGFLDTQPQPADPSRPPRLVALARAALAASVPLTQPTAAAPRPVPPPPPPAPAPAPARSDALFALAVLGLVAVLGVLIYLLLSLK